LWVPQAKVRNANASNPIRVGDLVQHLIQFHRAELVQIVLGNAPVPAFKAARNQNHVGLGQQPGVQPPAGYAPHPRVIEASDPADGPRSVAVNGPRSIYPRVIINSDGPEWVHITSPMSTEEHKRTYVLLLPSLPRSIIPTAS